MGNDDNKNDDGGDPTSVTTTIDSLRSLVRDRSVIAIDVRKPNEYAKGHIPTAVNLPLADLLADDGPKQVAKLVGSLGIDDETDVVVYDDTFGALASRIAWTLEYIGHKRVVLLDTTFDQWRSLGLETDTAAPSITAKNHTAAETPDILATHDYLESAVRNNYDNTGATLIDNRERLNYLEQHIPGAISLPYRTLADNDNRILRSKSDMQRLFANRGIKPDSEIITYCGSVGTLSGLGYYALKSAGFSNTRLYVRSFKEWKSLQKPTLTQPDANYWDLSAE